MIYVKNCITSKFKIYEILILHIKYLIRWFELRKEAETFYQIPINDQPCTIDRPPQYVPMFLQNAKFPDVKGFKADESPDVLKPTKESRYITENYDTFVGGHDVPQ